MDTDPVAAVLGATMALIDARVLPAGLEQTLGIVRPDLKRVDADALTGSVSP